MALPAGFPPPVAKAVKPKIAKPAPDMSEVADDSAVSVPVVVPSVPVVVPSVPAVASAPLPGAVGIPSSAGAFGELGQLPAASNISPLTIILALVAVGGGGAAWKFYSQRSKEKHEEAMARIEKGDANSDQQRQKCDSAAQWSKEKIEGLTARADASASSLENVEKRLAYVEEKSAEIDALDSRVSTLERKAATEKKSSRSKGGAK